MRKRLFAEILATALLAGCATTKTEPVVRTVEVKVPVRVPCVDAKVPPAPAYPDTDEALRKAAGPEDRFQLMAAGRVARIARAAVTEPVIDLCRK